MNEFECAIKRHLDQYATGDKSFAEKYDVDRITDCCNYIIAEVQKMNVSALPKESVYGMAIHYYDENLRAPANGTKCNVVVTQEPAPQDPPKEAAPKKKKEAPKVPFEDKRQLTLF